MIHDLKTWPEHFRDVRAGIKTAELRLNDRNYQPGDVLVLREYDPETGEYTGAIETRTVTHVLEGETWLQHGVVMLSMSGENPIQQHYNCTFNVFGLPESALEGKSLNESIARAVRSAFEERLGGERDASRT